MNLYSEIVRDTSINTLSTPKYHPLFFSPPHDKSGFSTSKGEKDISDTRISDSFRRPCVRVYLKPCFQGLLSLDGRGILPCGISDKSEKIADFIPQGEGEGDLFSAVSSQQKRRELTRVLVRLNLTHTGQLWYRNGIQARIIVMSLKNLLLANHPRMKYLPSSDFTPIRSPINRSRLFLTTCPKDVRRAGQAGQALTSYF